MADQPIIVLTQEQLAETIGAAVSQALEQFQARAPAAAPVDHPWMTCAEVAKLLNVDQSTVRRWSARGDFPAPVEINAHTLRWPRAEIEQHIERQKRT